MTSQDALLKSSAHVRQDPGVFLYIKKMTGLAGRISRVRGFLCERSGVRIQTNDIQAWHSVLCPSNISGHIGWDTDLELHTHGVFMVLFR